MATAMRQKPNSKAKADEVGVNFRATQQVRGSIKSVSAWCEMNNIRIGGRVPIEKDIWSWIAASFYQSGKENWIELMTKGANDHADLIAKN